MTGAVGIERERNRSEKAGGADRRFLYTRTRNPHFTPCPLKEASNHFFFFLIDHFNHFTVWESVVLSTFADTTVRLQYIAVTGSCRLVPTMQSLPPALATTSLLSVSVGLFILDGAYKWDDPDCDLSRQAHCT